MRNAAGDLLGGEDTAPAAAAASGDGMFAGLDVGTSTSASSQQPSHSSATPSLQLYFNGRLMPWLACKALTLTYRYCSNALCSTTDASCCPYVCRPARFTTILQVLHLGALLRCLYVRF